MLNHEEVKVIIYIDDDIATFRTVELAKSAAHSVRSDLISVRFVINEDKSDLILKNKREMAGCYY